MKTLFRISLFFTMLLFGSFQTMAQTTTIKGTVTDEENEPLPFAQIVFKGTTIGVQADFDGKFELTTDDTSLDTIKISYISYADLFYPVKVGQTEEVNLVLRSDAAITPDVEIIISAERPKKDSAAIELYKKVVANKAQNRPKAFDYISYQQYEKTEFDLYNLSDKFKDRKIIKPIDFIFDNVDTTDEGVEYLPFLIKEQISDVYQSKDFGKKQLITADQFSGIESQNVAALVDYSFEVVDVYDNQIQVSGKNFTGPFANNARLRYRYFLADSSQVEDHYCYKLEFTGINNQDLAFSGYAWIDTVSYGIKEVSMYVLPGVNINFITELSLSQGFIQTEEGAWFKNNDYFVTALNLGKNEEKQSFMVKKTTNYRNVKTGIPIPRNYFKGDKVEYAEGSRKRNKEYWEKSRPIRLSKTESQIFEVVDSVQRTKYYKTLSWFSYLGTTAYAKAGPVELGRFYKFFSWNAIEGNRFRIGGRTSEWNFSEKIQILSYVAYGQRDEKWKYHVGLRVPLKSQNFKWHMIGGDYRFDLTQLDLINPLFTHDNLVLSLLRGEPLDNLLQTRWANVFYEKEWLPGFTTKLSLDHTTYFSIPTGFQFEGSNDEGMLVPVDDFTTSEVTLGILYGPKQKWLETRFRRFPLTYRLPVIALDYTAGVKTLGGEFSYHKLDFSMRHRYGNPLGYTLYTLLGGKVFGEAPFPVEFLHRGNESLVANRFAFNILNEFEFVSDQYVGIQFEQHFEGLIMNQLPLIKKLKLRSFVTFRGFYGTLDEDRVNKVQLPGGLSGINGYYGEAGFGIENIFKIGRIEFLWRLTQRDKPEVTRWGIRLAFQPQF